MHGFWMDIFWSTLSFLQRYPVYALALFISFGLLGVEAHHQNWGLYIRFFFQFLGRIFYELQLNTLLSTIPGDVNLLAFLDSVVYSRGKFVQGEFRGSLKNSEEAALSKGLLKSKKALKAKRQVSESSGGKDAILL